MKIRSTLMALVFALLFFPLSFRVDVAPAPSPSGSGSGDDCSLTPSLDVAPRCSCNFRQASANMPPPPDDCAHASVGAPCRSYFEKPGTCEYTCEAQKNSKTGKKEFTGCLNCSETKPCAEPKGCTETPKFPDVQNTKSP